MQILGGVGAGASPPTEAPTGLSAIPSTTSVTISFTPGFDGGLAITNYEYAISTDGSTYGSWTAISPADPLSPIGIGSLLDSQNYWVKLRAVNNLGVGPESSALSFSTPPLTPTSLSTIPTNDSVQVSFSQSVSGASAITNYYYSIETSAGGSFATYTAISPADFTSPITISGLTQSTTYYLKLKSYNGVDYSDASSVTSFTTLTPYTVEYLVVAGGGSSAGGGGGMVVGTSTIYNSTDYSIQIGAGGSGGSKGGNSVFHNVTGFGGGGSADPNGGSGAGGGTATQTSPAGGTGYGRNGGVALGGADYGVGHNGQPGGGGALNVGSNQSGNAASPGGSGRANTITGSTVYYSGGGGGNGHCNGCGTGDSSGGAGGGGNGSRYSFGNQACSADGGTNTGGGGGARCGGGYSCGTTNGGSGVVIIAYPSSYGNLASIGAGLVYTLSTGSRAGYHVYRFTGGTGNIRF